MVRGKVRQHGTGVRKITLVRMVYGTAEDGLRSELGRCRATNVLTQLTGADRFFPALNRRQLPAHAFCGASRRGDLRIAAQEGFISAPLA